MVWLSSQIAVFVVITLVLLIGSFLRVRFVRPNRALLILAVVFLCLTGLGGVQLLRNPPEKNKEIVDESTLDITPIRPTQTALMRLQSYWNSEESVTWPAAETLADLSEKAYLPPYMAMKEFESLGFTKVFPFVEGSMIGYIVSCEDVTVIIFRGTNFNEMSDWLANLSTSALQTPHGKIHKGFYSSYKAMKWQIEDILKECNTKHLWITGHSLGGALALVCAYDFADNESRPFDGVITFGQPMIARKDLAQYLDNVLVGKYARFVNRDDIVPKVPPNHDSCGSLVWFTDSGLKRSKNKAISYASSPDGVPVSAAVGSNLETEIQPLSEREFRQLQTKLKQENELAERLPDGTPTQMEEYPTAGPVDDHSMLEYVSRIRKLLGL